MTEMKERKEWKGKGWRVGRDVCRPWAEDERKQEKQEKEEEEEEDQVLAWEKGRSPGHA